MGAQTLFVALVAAVAALIVAEIVHRGVRRLSKRSVVLAELCSHARRAFQVFLVLLALRITVAVMPHRFDIHPAVLQGLGITVLLSGAWLVTTILIALEDAAESRYRVDVPDNRRARRIRTRAVVLRRVTIATVVVVTIGLVLTTFTEVRTLGTSLLASAGVLGIIVGLAAQSVLGNVIAGLQLAFSDAIRLDDVVVVEREWARVEEITLTHVVLQIWDERRLILPSSYFTSMPYENWTRTRADVIGSVEFDVDWETPLPRMREELRRAVEANDLWDGRLCVLQLTDATEGRLRVRALVSAVNAPTLWDLRCDVREYLASWVRDEHPASLVRTRVEAASDDRQAWSWSRRQPLAPKEVAGEEEEDSRVFGGSPEGEARGEAFTGRPRAEQAPAQDPPRSGDLPGKPPG